MANLCRTVYVGDKIEFFCGGERVSILVQHKRGQGCGLSIDAPLAVAIIRKPIAIQMPIVAPLQRTVRRVRFPR